jgi:hypothetical protein
MLPIGVATKYKPPGGLLPSGGSLGSAFAAFDDLEDGLGRAISASCSRDRRPGWAGGLSGTTV